MKKYYGLRVMSVFYHTLATVVAIVSISITGLVIGNHFLGAGSENWVFSAFSILIIGGLFALTCYVVGQLIDSQLETLEAVKDLSRIYNELEQIKHLLKSSQLRKAEEALNQADASDVYNQLSQRKQHLGKK